MGIHCESRHAASLDSVAKIVATGGGSMPTGEFTDQGWRREFMSYQPKLWKSILDSCKVNSSHTSFSILMDAVCCEAGSRNRFPDSRTLYWLHLASTSRAWYHCCQRMHHHLSDPVVLGLPKSTRESCSLLLAQGLQLPMLLNSISIWHRTLNIWSPWATGEVLTTLWETNENFLHKPEF